MICKTMLFLEKIIKISMACIKNKVISFVLFKASKSNRLNFLIGFFTKAIKYLIDDCLSKTIKISITFSDFTQLLNITLFR